MGVVDLVFCGGLAEVFTGGSWCFVPVSPGLEPRLRLLRIQTLNPKFCLMSPAHVGWFVGFRVCKVEVRVESRKFMVCKATS